MDKNRSVPASLSSFIIHLQRIYLNISKEKLWLKAFYCASQQREMEQRKKKNSIQKTECVWVTCVRVVCVGVCGEYTLPLAKSKTMCRR